MLLKCAASDPQLARELLAGLPLHKWNRKTLRGILRFMR